MLKYKRHAVHPFQPRVRFIHFDMTMTNFAFEV